MLELVSCGLQQLFTSLVTVSLRQPTYNVRLLLDLGRDRGGSVK